MKKTAKQNVPIESGSSTPPALRYMNPALRKQAWQLTQELAAQWRATQNPDCKNAAASLLYDLMASEALVIIKSKKVDAKLPASLRRDYPEMADDVATSVLSHNYSRFTAILENHDPDKASLQTMVARYLHNKVVDHLRDEPLPRHFRTGVKAVSGRRPFVHSDDSIASSPDKSTDSPKEAAPTLSSLETDAVASGPTTPPAPTRGSSMLSDDAPDKSPPPPDDFEVDATGEVFSDLAKVLDPQESEVLWYDTAGYTAAEASAAIGISESTYKRRLSSAQEKIKAYFDLKE